MDLEHQFLDVLKRSRPAYDEKPDWRSALDLYRDLSPAAQAELDRLVLRMIDEDYRNPHSSREDLPFDDAIVALPDGMAPDDLLCIEGASMVAAARTLGAAFFALNRLLRAPRWHALMPRLIWLAYEGFEAQRSLAATRAGRTVAVLLGAVLGDSLRPGPDGLEVGEPGERAATMLNLAQHIGELPAGWVAPSGDAVLDLLPALAFPPITPLQQVLAHLLDGHPKSDMPADSPETALLRGTHTLEDCMARSVNNGSDLLVAGALAGACYGPLAFPRRWSLAMRDRPGMEALAESLHALWSR